MHRLLLPILMLLGVTASPCTTFFINHNGEMVFGRNYDWVTGNGMVCTNHRGLLKTSMPVPDGRTISWTSRYGSITFNQYGKEFPTGGMNEKGLVVELMWLDETSFPAKDDRAAIGVLQWIQYHLDNHATIEEVIAADKILRPTATSAPLHYLIADANGNAATIEYLNGKLVVHKEDKLPFAVLTNSSYQESKQMTNKEGNSTYESFQDNSIERFVIACRMVEQLKAGKVTKQVTDHAFDILHKVSQGNHTKWSIVYDIKNKTIRYRTMGHTDIKLVRFAAFDLNCKATAKTYDMNLDVAGDVSKLFTPYNENNNLQLLKRSAEESRSQINISAESIRKSIEYSSVVICNADANKPKE